MSAAPDTSPLPDIDEEVRLALAKTAAADALLAGSKHLCSPEVLLALHARLEVVRHELRSALDTLSTLSCVPEHAAALPPTQSPPT